jgi:hypothetical protein
MPFRDSGLTERNAKRADGGTVQNNRVCAECGYRYGEHARPASGERCPTYKPKREGFPLPLPRATVKLDVKTLRPGLLVGLKTSLRGGVSYAKRTIEPEHVEGAALVAKWETERTITDAEEHKAAVKVRSDAVYTVRKVCAVTAFGYLCPEAKQAALEQAIERAHAMVAAFNASARSVRLSFYVITGRVAPDDVEAVRAIHAEVRELMADMENGVRALDARAVRAAAERAKAIGQMLSEESRVKVEGTVSTMRSAARSIAKAARAGTLASLTINEMVFAKMRAARTAFLELGDAADVQAPASTIEPRAIDFDATPETASAAPALAARNFEIEE